MNSNFRVNEAIKQNPALESESEDEEEESGRQKGEQKKAAINRRISLLQRERIRSELSHFLKSDPGQEELERYEL